MPGWVPPAAYGTGRLTGGRLEFARINAGDHPLPAAVLATVCGHRSGPASYRLDRAALSRAVALLAPAEACTAYEHPNLAAWRQLEEVLGADGVAIAAFVADLGQPCADRYAEQLRQAVLAG